MRINTGRSGGRVDWPTPGFNLVVILVRLGLLLSAYD